MLLRLNFPVLESHLVRMILFGVHLARAAVLVHLLGAIWCAAAAAAAEAEAVPPAPAKKQWCSLDNSLARAIACNRQTRWWPSSTIALRSCLSLSRDRGREHAKRGPNVCVMCDRQGKQGSRSLLFGRKPLFVSHCGWQISHTSLPTGWLTGLLACAVQFLFSLLLLLFC